MNPRQARFAREYITDHNGTQAAIRAGYSRRTAQEQSSDLLSHPIISAEIRRREIRLAERTELKQETIARELAKMAFASLADFMSISADGTSMEFDFSACERADIDGIAEFTTEEFRDGRTNGRITRRTKLKLKKYEALVDLAKMLGFYRERVEVSFADPLQAFVDELAGRVLRPKELAAPAPITIDVDVVPTAPMPGEPDAP